MEESLMTRVLDLLLHDKLQILTATKDFAVFQ
jgi:hypothetical protein